MSKLPHATCDNQPRDGGSGVSRRRSPSISNLEPHSSNASSDVNRVASLNVASLFSQITPDWEIEEKTHLPLHHTNCNHCFQFAGHVADYTRGGAISMFVNLQREHWHKTLELDSRNKEDDAYSAGLDKNQQRVNWLEDELDKCHNRLKALERENDQLRRKLDEFKDSNARVSGGEASRGKDSYCSRLAQRRQSPPPPLPRQSSAPTGNGRGKQKATPASPSPPPCKRSKPMYDMDSDNSSVIWEELRGNTPLNSEEEAVMAATVKESIRQQIRDSHRIEGEAAATSSISHHSAPVAEPNPHHSRTRTGGL
ncbi:hypothetical protein F5887DRAFT_1071707 [Amanita rubescens]|nr:hypothetical protein F5887DRAFT_1071707 [Amanita rubescens]